MEMKHRSVVARSWKERGNRKSLPTVYTDSVWGDGKVLEIDSGGVVQYCKCN